MGMGLVLGEVPWEEVREGKLMVCLLLADCFCVLDEVEFRLSDITKLGGADWGLAVLGELD